MVTKNGLIFASITGYAIPGIPAGAESEGWREGHSLEQAIAYHDAVVAGDLGEEIAERLEQADGEFVANTVAVLLQAAKAGKG